MTEHERLLRAMVAGLKAIAAIQHEKIRIQQQEIELLSDLLRQLEFAVSLFEEVQRRDRALLEANGIRLGQLE